MNRHAWAALIAAILLAGAEPARAIGPLSVSPDGRELLGQRGNPVFLNGDAPWHILGRLDRDQTIRYLDSRQARGFNALLVSILVDDDFRTGSFDNAFGEPPFLVPNDFSTPNEAYFAHVDWFLAEAARRDMVVLLVPAYIGYDCQREGFCQAMKDNGVAKMRDYGRWLGTRYRDFGNVVWVDGGDADAAAAGALDVVEAVAEGILETSPDQLHTAHCNRFNSAADCYDRPWLDLNNTYSDCSATPRDLHDDWVRTPVRPFFYIEGWYEGEHDTSAVCLRSQAYWSLLSGAVGHVFGNNPMWDFWDGWTGALDSPGSVSMQHFSELVLSRDWASLQPDYAHQVLVAGYGSLDDGSYAACARTRDGHTVIVYTPERRTLTVDLNQVSGTKAHVWWFNPSNGTTVFLDSLPTEGWREFTPPFAADWVLVIDDDSRELPAPGQGVGTETTSTGMIKARFAR